MAIGQTTIYQGELTFHTALDQLLSHQKQFIGAPYRNVAYVGGVGSGKSIALCLSALINGYVDPGGFSLIGRLNMPALIDSTMKTFLELTPSAWGIWKPTEKRFIMDNGHEYIFRHLDMSDPKVAGHIKSMNLSAAYVDEATEISEDIYMLLLSRIRRKLSGEKARHLMRLATNPAGQDWVWRNYFDEHRSDSLKEHNLGLTASTFDNIHLPQAYIQSMVATYPKDWADRYLYGSFADFSDLVYKEFSTKTHVWNSQIPQPFFQGNLVPPEGWPVIIGIDIGSDTDHDPWGIVLISVAPDGSLYQFDEVYGKGLLIKDIAEQMWAKMGRRRSFNTANVAYDYAQRQCALELAEYDIGGAPAEKEVQPGLFKVAQYMHIDPRLTHPFDLGLEGAPRYYVASHCTQTIRELTGYKYAKDKSGNPTGEPAHAHSHIPDAIRYAIHTFRPLPEKMKTLAMWQNPALDEQSRLYWRDVERHNRDNERLPEGERYQKARGLRFQRPQTRPNMHV